MKGTDESTFECYFISCNNCISDEKEARNKFSTWILIGLPSFCQMHCELRCLSKILQLMVASSPGLIWRSSGSRSNVCRQNVATNNDVKERIRRQSFKSNAEHILKSLLKSSSKSSSRYTVKILITKLQQFLTTVNIIILAYSDQWMFTAHRGSPSCSLVWDEGSDRPKW